MKNFTMKPTVQLGSKFQWLPVNLINEFNILTPKRRKRRNLMIE
jgi:hypothetical protein